MAGLLKNKTVTIIFKEREKRKCSSYRLGVLIFHLVKIFEKVISDQFTRHQELETLFGQKRHDFQNGRSCASQLIQHHHTVLTTLEVRHDADGIYLGFKKAFDRVGHGWLLCNLKSLGFGSTLIR